MKAGSRSQAALIITLSICYEESNSNINSLCVSLSFPGDRFVRSVDDKDVVIILDGNGFIAGMQSVLMKEYTLNETFNFDNDPYYVLGDWNGEEAYFQTVYFVDTNIICNGGRSEEEFQNEGTGNRFSWQNGPTNMDLEEIPLTKDEMLGNVSKTCGFVINVTDTLIVL